MRVLIVNPWIYDFSAYDLWVRPLGLLRIASVLRQEGFYIDFIDCMDRFDKDLLRYRGIRDFSTVSYSCGKFFKCKVEKPRILDMVDRHFFRYGLPEEFFIKKLKEINRPDIILVGSMMTYWYIGVFECIKIMKRFFNDVPIILGGVYATLCHQHAKENSSADFVFCGDSVEKFLCLIKQVTGCGISYKNYEFEKLPYPAFDLLSSQFSICIQTSKGCPFSCSYCAKDIISPQFIQRAPISCVDEIRYYVSRYKTTDIAFYDDALLVDSSAHIKRILKELIKLDLRIRFHTPNGLHPRFIDEELAHLLYRSGFETLRLSLESTDEDIQHYSSGKVTTKELVSAVKHLLNADFKPSQIGVYLMVGLPGQGFGDILGDINFVKGLGVRPVLAAFSPVPGTKLWDELKQKGLVSDKDDPLIHNKTIFSSITGFLTLTQIRKLRRLSAG